MAFTNINISLCVNYIIKTNAGGLICVLIMPICGIVMN